MEHKQADDQTGFRYGSSGHHDFIKDTKNKLILERKQSKPSVNVRHTSQTSGSVYSCCMHHSVVSTTDTLIYFSC